MIRVPKINVPNKVTENTLTWHSLACELITPMYGGGTESTKVDIKMPIRASSIRGGLRFWWRLLAKNKWKLNDIPKAESELWGGVGSGDDDGKAGKVLLKIAKQPKVNGQDLAPYTNYMATSKEMKEGKRRLEYILFPANNAENKENNPHKLLKPDNIKFQLEFAFVNVANEQKEQVVETLQWWANFGGLGFRSRKGLGAIAVTQCADFPEICRNLTADEVVQANCTLAIRNGNNNATATLEQGIQRYSDFRQRAGVGRNEGQQPNRPGRSRFPEPDALRRIKRTHHANHAPEHPAGNIFPRAVFGLPIIYHFVGHNEPSDTNVVLSDGDRLASPLIIRPRKNGNGYQVVALALPYQDILDKKVLVNGNEYPIWQEDTAQHIAPIGEYGGNDSDPIQAFLTYFARP